MNGGRSRPSSLSCVQHRSSSNESLRDCKQENGGHSIIDGKRGGGEGEKTGEKGIFLSP